MKVTPVSTKFGKYSPGEEFELPDKAAKVFVRVGKLRQVERSMTYQTRELRADPAPRRDDNLEAMKAEADRRGIKYHHLAGAAKLRELLES